MANFRLPQDYKKRVKRSNYDLSRDFRGSIKSCCNIPVYFKTLKPGDKFDMKFASKLMSEALVKPLLGDYVLRFAWFKSSSSNYYGWLDNNSKHDSKFFLSRSKHYISGYPVVQSKVDPWGQSTVWSSRLAGLASRTYDYEQEDGTKFKTSYDSILPIFSINDFDFIERSCSQREFETIFGVKNSSLLDYCGITPGYVVPDVIGNDYSFNLDKGRFSRTFDAAPLLVYLDCIRNYMVSQQMEVVPYSFNPIETWDDQVGTYNLKALRLEDIDRFFQLLRMEQDGVDIAEFLVRKFNQFRWSDDTTGTVEEKQTRNIGAMRVLRWFLDAKDYGLINALSAPDLMQNLLRTSAGSDVSVTVEDGQFTINNLRFQNKLQKFVERYDISNGRASGWLRTLWGQDSPKDMDIPDLIQVSTAHIGSETIISTANTLQASGDVGSPVGELSGVINEFSNSKTERKPFDFYVNNEHNVDSYLICIASLVPKVDYYLGVDTDLCHTMFSDDYVPEFDNLGFQDVPFGRYNMLTPLSSTDINQFSRASTVVGKEVAWMSMMTDINRVHGSLGNNGENQTWVLLRRYDGTFDDFYYLYPGDFQYMFELNQPGRDNFTLQVAFNVRAVRCKGQSYMPTLE